MILKYFKPIGKKEKDFALLDPSSLLSERVLSLSIEAINNKVSKLIVNPLESLSESMELCAAVKVIRRIFQVLLDSGMSIYKNIDEIHQLYN